MQDDISIDIFSKNDDDPDLGEDFEDDFAENFEGPAPRRREAEAEADDDYDQKYEELRKSVSQLFFGICTLFETVQARAAAAEKGGEADAAANPEEHRQPETRTLRSPTPWWAWANLGLSGIVLLALFVSLVF
jgi:hypothetical protein